MAWLLRNRKYENNDAQMGRMAAKKVPVLYLETMEETQKESKESHSIGYTGMAGVGSKQLPKSLLAYGQKWPCAASNLNRKTRTGRILQYP